MVYDANGQGFGYRYTPEYIDSQDTYHFPEMLTFAPFGAYPLGGGLFIAWFGKSAMEWRAVQ
jgi:hypothetical protein